MSKFCPLFSSSSGNCVYVGDSQSGILIDVGVSTKRTCDALEDIGVSPSSVKAIFVTHEHSDHIAGVRVFASRYKVPVYASEGTLKGMETAGCINGKFDYFVMPSSGVETGSMFVRAFHTPHDCNESLGYTVQMPDGTRIGIATDLGTVTDEVLNDLVGCRMILLESNHDLRMLQVNPNYPYELKRRILSDRGHLSNDLCAETARLLVESGTTHLLLGHLSKENNMPELAYRCTESELSSAGMTEGRDYMLGVAGVGQPRPIRF